MNYVGDIPVSATRSMLLKMVKNSNGRSGEFFSNMNHVGKSPFSTTRGMSVKRMPSISNMDLVADTLPSMTSPRKALATCCMLLKYFQQHG
ncbi:hypothetical protein SLE2022_117920 [Rubroshorea leprosula]